MEFNDLILRGKNFLDREGWKIVQDYGIKNEPNLPNGAKNATEWETDALDPFNNKVVHFRYDFFQALDYDNSKYTIITSYAFYTESPPQLKQEVIAGYELFLSKLRITNLTS